MTGSTEKKFPVSYRLRVLTGIKKGQWIADMTASNGGNQVNSPNWVALERNPLQHAFHPTYIEFEDHSFRFLDLNKAEVWQKILARLGVQTETVPYQPKANPQDQDKR